MHVAITGSSGFIGSALVARLQAKGHVVTRVVRGSAPGEADGPCVVWDPANGQIDAAALEGHDAVIHLAAANVAERRWTAAFKRVLRDSRVQGTALLCETLARLTSKPKVLLSASAIGYYGSQSVDEAFDESSPAGEGFLADVCAEWEQATTPAATAGVRVALMRIGFVLAANGGGLAKMLPAFRAGAGGRIGSGRQMVSWVTLDDLCDAFCHALATETLAGPVNITAPGAVSNAEFATTLGRVLRRPASVPLPAFAARLLLGELADAVLLSGAVVRPTRLQRTGYTFQHTELEPALRAVLSPSPVPQA
ncbi:MAG: TIGR01777 family oxidoreductase [Phycisphaerae bacterium]|nr:TIGR01777 family oxidoreductase [Phycisphaerae bacterium]